MAKTQTHLQVFIASPMDVSDERKIMNEVIDELNNIIGYQNNVHLDLVMYETHTYPSFGKDAQDVINNQIGNDYDIFIGIMWGRFGSKTLRADSGTEEEFNRALERFRSLPESIQIMFYFKDAGIPPSKIDAEQLKKVQDFQEKISKEYGGLYYPFETTEDFRTKVRLHLNKVVHSWLENNVSNGSSNLSQKEELNLCENHSLSNFNALLDDDYEEGFIELSLRTENALAMVTDIVKRIAASTTELGIKFRQRTDEINKFKTGNKVSDTKLIERVSNSAANDLEEYVTTLFTEIPNFSKQHQLAMDTFGNIAMIACDNSREDMDNIKNIIILYQNSFSLSVSSLSSFRASIYGISRMTSSFNRAKRRSIALIDDFLEVLRIAEGQVNDVKLLLE